MLTAGQQFITLVPSNAPLEIEANIPGSEDGYVHVGDPVAVKFDTFPYTQYGMANGVVRIISPDSFNAQDEQRNPSGLVPIPQPGTTGMVVGAVWYRTRITLDQIGLHDTPVGFRLSPGMPVTADVLVGKRTVMAYFLGRALAVKEEGMRRWVERCDPRGRAEQVSSASGIARHGWRQDRVSSESGVAGIGLGRDRVSPRSDIGHEG